MKLSPSRSRILQRAAALANNAPARAIPLLEELLRADSRDCQACQILAFVRLKQDRPAEAVELLRAALVVRPEAVEIWRSLGVATLRAGLLSDAVAAYRQAARLAPAHPAAWLGLGNACAASQHFDDALAAYCRALRHSPDPGPVLRKAIEVSRCLLLVGREAALLRRLVARAPDAQLFHELGLALCYSGRVREGLTAFRKALSLDPALHQAQSGIVMGMQMIPGITSTRVFREHRLWGLRFTVPPAPLQPFHRSSGPLRIGYASGQFTDSSASFFFEPILRSHDPRRVRVTCYSNVERPDHVTHRLQSLAPLWRDIAAAPDDEAAERIRNDNLDILIDLDGHGHGHRLQLCARKLAPVQATYLGYPNTTGLTAMDYRITDAVCDPPGTTERYHTESLARLDPCFLTYQPPVGAPAPGPLPSAASGKITFVCFSSSSKLNLECLGVFARVLAEVPDSQLLLKCRSFHDPLNVRRIGRFFASHGIEHTRIRALPSVANRLEHLHLYRQADIALDSFPYVGTTTTCEALWMGLPVVSLAGTTHVQRVGVTLLRQAGLPQLAVTSPDEFVRAAVDLAAHPEELAKIRASLRLRLRRSALLDHRAFTRQFEALLAGLTR